MSDTQPETFPLGKAVNMAYRSLFLHPLYALRICWAWIVVMTSARIASDILKADLLTDAAGEPLLGFDLTFFIGWFLFIPLASIAVAWHRLLLFGERDDALIYLRLDRLVASYFGFAVLLYAISLAPVVGVRGVYQVMELFLGVIDGSTDKVKLPTMARSINAWLQVGAFLVFLAVSARLSVVLPGKAFDGQGLTLKRAWKVTRGNTWGVMMGFIACIVPFLVLTALLRRSGFNFSLEDGALLHIADWLVIESMGAVLGLIEMSYLTFCFRFFFPRQNQQISAPLSA